MELSNEFEVSVPLDQAWSVLTDLERIAPCLPGAQLQEVEGDEYRGIVKVKVGPITAQYKGAAHFVDKDDTAHRAVLSASGRDTRGQGNASASITAELTPRGDNTQVSILTDLTITGKVAQFGRGVIGDISVKLLDQFVENLHSTVLGDVAPMTAPSEADREVAPVAVDQPADASEGKSEGTTEMLASELAKVWDETEGRAGGTVRAERPTLEPRPDLLAEEQGLASEPSGEVAAESASTTVASSDVGIRRIDAPEPDAIDLLGTAGSPLAKRALPLVGLAAAVLVLLALLRRRRQS